MARIKNIIFVFFVFAAIHTSAQEQGKLYIQTDKPFYHAGEMIWFRIDVLDSASTIAYVELLDSGNRPVLQDKIKLINTVGAGSLAIPANLTADNYVLRGYTNWMKNYGPESFFTKQISIINLLQSPKATLLAGMSTDLSPEIKTDKHSYKTREKVTVNLDGLKLRASSAGGIDNKNRISVSVYKLDSVQSANKFIQHQASVSLKYNNFIKEEKGNIITGKVTSLKTGSPVPNVNCYLSIIGPVNMFYTTTSDTAGNIMFEVKNVYDDNQVVLQAADSNYLVEIDNEFSKEYTTVNNAAVVVNDHNAFLDHAISAQVQLIYKRDKDSVNIFVGDTLPFYGYAEYSYLVDEYVKFSSIEDIFREYIRPVQIYKRGGGVVPIIFLDKERRLMNKSPFVLIDNVPVFNMRKLMGINPAKLQRIDVVDRPYWYKQQFYEGIISVFTKNKDPEDYLSRSARVQYFKGLQLTRNFYSPVYDTEAKRNSRLPDFRNVLYWSPAINHQPIEFYTSDLPGDYAVVIQSISENGEIVNRVAKFVVE